MFDSLLIMVNKKVIMKKPNEYNFLNISKELYFTPISGNEWINSESSN